MSLRSVLAVALFAAAAGCGSYSAPATTSPTPTPTTGGATGSPVAIVAGASNLTATAFAPNPITISAGGTVTWTNNDVTSHTSTADDGSWNSGSIGPGRTFSRTFPSAGTFNYHCSLHPGMSGTVKVQ